MNPEDKPETENFKKYVAGIMVVNWNLLPMLVSYVKNKTRILRDRKEGS
ncbi:MAG: hypothetical protein IPK58_02925 [Acidobacteria bacterium]|nr:hypothetical protein [Acidobacteriota bacterium]